MSNYKSLIFFNKSGDSLNFEYNQTDERFEGDILFDVNSSDTFKSFGLYMFEKIPAFDYQLPGQLTLDKFQLFNEYGLHFYGSKYATQSVTFIEPVNNDPSFYSKWIYGVDFEAKFPVGSIITFDVPFLEFTNSNKTYVVVMTKKNAIMVISSLDNSTFEGTYFSTYTNPSSFTNITISGANVVGVYNYIDGTFKNNLSSWSEPNFYDKYYVGKKLNIVNTKSNNYVLTVANPNVTDLISYEYYLSGGVPTYSNLIIEVIIGTDLPIIYQGPLTIDNNTVTFSGSVPIILTPGIEFKIIGSTLNSEFLSVSSIPSFTGNNRLTYYATQSQVLWNNLIYQCVNAYTQSATLDVNPASSSFWSLSNYVPIDQPTSTESLLNCQVYLTTDHLYFEYGWTFSESITLASAAQNYAADLKLFNIDLYYSNNKIKADLIYPSKYAEVNFYYDQVGSTHSIGSILQTYERAVEVRETLVNELNYNLSSNFSYNIVFTHLDSFGIIININKMVYQEEIDWVYSGVTVDMERTIDRTLRNWLTRNYIKLATLGVFPSLSYIGNFSSIYNNSIILKTQYPNVPIDFSVEVGSTAVYNIEHSSVLFTDLGGYLSFNINGQSYDQVTINLTGTMSQYPDIPSTLSAWVTAHSDFLLELGIYVVDYNNLLKFDILDLTKRFTYSITIGKSLLPGQSAYTIFHKMSGNEGALISSNEITLPIGSASLEDAGFATGMLVAINNTLYPFNNQEYNIQYLDPNSLNLSYQGPFWGLTDSICNSSAFVTIAFNIGFGQTGCPPSFGPTAGAQGGPFDPTMFSSSMFTLTYNPNTYTVNTYNLNSFPGSSNLVDINYVQLSNSIYGYGTDIVVMDAFLGQYITTIPLGNTQSVTMKYNPINNHLYCLSKSNISVVDPLLNVVFQTITLNSFNDPYDLEINTTNGDIYVSYGNPLAHKIDIWDVTNVAKSPVTGWGATYSGSFKMAYNVFQDSMYITTDANVVLRVYGNSTPTFTTYGVNGTSPDYSIIYEPVNESIYVYGSASLWKIYDPGTGDIPFAIPAVPTQAFNEIIFNNLTGDMNISDTSTNFTSLDSNTNNITQSGLSNYGYLVVNQFDGDVYLSSLLTNTVLVIDGISGAIRETSPMSTQTTKIIYNPQRNSVWALQPSTNSIVEIIVTLNSSINIIPSTYSVSGENMYGTLDPNYVPRSNLWLKTREYIRRPRENYQYTSDVPVQYYWKWFSDNIPQFFLYDFSGTQLPTSGPFAYTGPSPLDKIVLRPTPNQDITKVSFAENQQTVFDTITQTLEFIDDSTDLSNEPEPMELFIGFNAPEEGALRSVLQLFKHEDVKFDTISSPTNNNIITFQTFTASDGTTYGQISLNSQSTDNFVGQGLKIGQLLAIFIKDNTNKKNQYISTNNGRLVTVTGVYSKMIIVDFVNPIYDQLDYETTVVSNFPSFGKTTYLTTTLQVWDVEIGRFNTYGQTEVEDIRFKIELSNSGEIIGSNETFIFKQYDINEGGIDWTFLNKKRKEMLMMRHLIYSYVGSYKAIINAINYFGYNDLELNEYYKDVNPNSPNYLQLFKVEVPNIFDNTIAGWTSNDFLKHTFPNPNYEETNLLNLTYDITDKQGNNILIYSLDEVIIKLQGLKYWLQRNVIPLTHKILDITGKAYILNTNQIQHKLYDASIFNTRQTMTPVIFNMNEAYLLPVSSGSTVYNCVLDFATQTQSLLPDYFTVNIKTYKTYVEWAPFTTYNIGDKVSYYGNIYESQVSNNKVNDPRKYQDSAKWSANVVYIPTNIVIYQRDIYVFSGLSSGTASATSSTLTPVQDPSDWLKITIWKQLDYEPVQKLYEYRTIDSLLPYNFTIDSNIDPFVSIEVTSDNGYGLTYADKKNYEVRGLVNPSSSITFIDPIGPFKPIPEI